MTIIRLFQFRCLRIVVLFALSLISCALCADDDKLRAVMSLVSDDDAAIRQQAINDLSNYQDERVLGFLDDYRLGRLFRFESQLVRGETQKDVNSVTVIPLEDYLDRTKVLDATGQQHVIIKRNLKSLVVPRADRGLLQDAILVQTLRSGSAEQRSEAAQRLGASRQLKHIPRLQEIVEQDEAAEVVYAARESIGILQLQDSAAEKDSILKAAKVLGELQSLRGKARLEQELKKIDDRLLKGELIDHEMRLTLHSVHQSIEQYHERTSLLKSLFNGISTGSILILISLGLAIVFGQMGVINMAHGELVMLGAYATYVMQLIFGHTPDDPNNWFYVAALPMAFIVAATAGILIEYFVVRHLYARPLESLLATWGVGLILIQFIRAGFPWGDLKVLNSAQDYFFWGGFGDNIGVNAPTWLVGAFELQPGLVIPYNRVFIIVLTIVIVATIAWMMKQTRLGLRIRATVQNRETAACLGVKTRQVDRITFAIGSGLAGIAGCALTTIAGVTPDMGQNYIVDSFLVVVTGGVGKLAGTVSAGGGIGVVNTWLETTTFGTGLFVTGLLMLVIGGVVLIRKVRSLKQMSLSHADDSQPWWKRYYQEKSVVKAVVILGMGVILMVAVRAIDTNNYLFIYDEDVTVDVDDALVLVDKQGRFRVFDFKTEEMRETSEFHVPIVLDPADVSFRQRTTDLIVQAIYSQDGFAVSASASGTRIALEGVAELNFSDDMNWLGVAEKGTEGFRAAPPKATREIPASTRIGAIPVRTIWAKVLILMVVMAFIQWRPAGLFPPRGRSADV